MRQRELESVKRTVQELCDHFELRAFEYHELSNLTGELTCFKITCKLDAIMEKIDNLVSLEKAISIRSKISTLDCRCNDKINF